MSVLAQSARVFDGTSLRGGNMAGDWIKIRTDLYRDPKVCMIADLLMSKDGDLNKYVNQNMQRDMTVTRNVMRNVTVGALVSVWGVMRTRGKRESNDLSARGVTVNVLDDIADLPGFGEAMEESGWVKQTDDGVVFPNFFEEFNADPAEKMKAMNAERQRRFREKCVTENNGDRNVTGNVTVTPREEKRREEKKQETPDPLFDKWYDQYAHKVGAMKARKAWSKLEANDKALCLAAVERYVYATPDVQFRKHPATYLNGRHWLDELPHDPLFDDPLTTEGCPF